MRSAREGDVHAIALVGELDIANADRVHRVFELCGVVELLPFAE